MLVQSSSLLLVASLLCTLMHSATAFDSTEIRLLEWPRGPKTFTKRSDILDMGVIGPLARFRKNDGMGRMIRNPNSIMRDPLVRFGKRSGADSEPKEFRRLARAYRLQVSDPMPEFWQ